MGRSSIVFDRMRTAIGRLSCDVQSQESSPEADASDREYILQGTHLRDVLLRSFRPAPATAAASDDVEGLNDRLLPSPSEPATDHDLKTVQASPDGIFAADMRIQSWARRYSRKEPLVVEGDPVLSDLNSTQIRAVAMMLENRFTLVQGVCIFFSVSIMPRAAFTDPIASLASRYRQDKDYHRGSEATESMSASFMLVHAHSQVGF